MTQGSTTLGQLCAAIVDCEHKSAPVTAGGGFWAVGTAAMRAGRIDYSAARSISAETFAHWTRRLRPRFGDLLLAREAPVGPLVCIPNSENVAPGQRTVLLRPARGVDPGYLFALLSSRPVQARLQERAEGSTVRHLNVPDIRSLALPPLPRLEEQRGIAETLGALDDKIDSNRRLIEKLQHLSVGSFRAWRSSCTDIVATTFGDFCDVYGGSTPRTDEPSNWGGPHWWATPTDLTALPAPYLFSTSRTVSDHGLTSCSAALHPPGTIFMTSRATIGAFAVNQGACATNQGFICARPRHDRDRWFLFEEMRMRVPEMLDRANGSTFLELSRRNFKEMTLQVPSEKDRDRLTDEVEPLHRLAAQRSQESRGLAELRDALLPELLSGRIRVPEAATT